MNGPRNLEGNKMKQFVEFTRVLIQEINGHILIKRIKVPINPDHVSAVTPFSIPSNLNGPDGKPVPKGGCLINLGPQEILVDAEMDEVLSRLGILVAKEDKRENQKSSDSGSGENQEDKPTIIKFEGKNGE